MRAARGRRLAVCAAAALALHLWAFDALRPAVPPSQAAAPAMWVRTVLPEPAPPAPVPPAEPVAPGVKVAARPAPKPAPKPAPEADTPPAPAAALAAAPVAVAVADTTAVASEPDAPVYATRLPPAATLRFRMRRGVLWGTANLTWTPTAPTYEARLEATIAGATVLEQVSRGGFDAAGLAPERFTDRRVRRGTAAANFQRAAGKLTFSGAPAEHPLSPGLQDGLSWLIQLAAIAQADPAALRPGAAFAIRVAGARGDLSTWVLRVEGDAVVPGSDPARRGWRLVRPPRGPHDGGAEVWLDPQHAYLPLRVVMHGGEADGRTDLELDRQSITMTP